MGGVLDGKLSGKGTLRYKDGSVFQGRLQSHMLGLFVDSKKNGPGTLVLPGEVRVEGKWVNNRIEGPVTVTYANGDTKQGSWHDFASRHTNHSSHDLPEDSP